MQQLFFAALFVVVQVQIFAQTQPQSLRDSITQLIDSSNSVYKEGNFIKSLDVNTKILEVAKKINDPIYLQKGYRFIGYDYITLQDTTLARESFEKAQFYAQILDNDIVKGQSFMDMGNLYARMSPNYFKKAIQYHKKSIATFEKTRDSFYLAKAYYNTVVAYLADNDLINTRKYLDKLPFFISDSDGQFCSGVSSLEAEYFFKNKEYRNAARLLKTMLDDSTNNLHNLDLQRSYDYYSESLFQIGEITEAYHARLEYENHYRHNIEIQSNFESEKASAQFQLTEYKQEAEKTELQNKLQDELMNSQRKLNIFLIFVTGISLLLLFILFAFVRYRKDYVRRLRDKNIKYLKAKYESEKLSKAKTDFFSTVSHELRTPLYGVVGLSTILMDDPALKSHEQDLKSLKFSADYLLALINDVLQISKIDSKRLEEEEENFNLKEFLRNIASSFEYMRIQNKNEMVLKIDERIPNIVKGDATRLSQILMNLIGNACKFTENGKIEIHLNLVEAKDKSVSIKFSIKDTGLGIPEANQSTIFDEFSQLKSKHYTYQGTGLGLPIVKKLLKLFNSDIQLESKEGEGSNFYFTIPFALTDGPIVVQANTMANEEILKNKKILVVDDNRINQIVTTKILDKLGVHIEVAENGKIALDLAKVKKYDLILMDINMPVMNGLEATEAIREFDQNIPIIALTAVEVKEMRTKIYASGLTDIVVKPYDISLFKRCILRNLMNPSRDAKVAG